MKLKKKAAWILAAAALFGSSVFPSTLGMTFQTVEAAFAPNTADRTPYEENTAIDPYGQTYFRALPVILRMRRETMEAIKKKMPWSGFGCYDPPGEIERIFSVLGEEAKEEQEEAL